MDRLDRAILRAERAERELEVVRAERDAAKGRIARTVAYVAALVEKMPKDVVHHDPDGQVLMPLKLEDDRSGETLYKDGDLDATLHLLREDVKLYKPSTARTRKALLKLLVRLNEPVEASPLNPNQQRGG
jgi:hypothetical protein